MTEKLNSSCLGFAASSLGARFNLGNRLCFLAELAGSDNYSRKYANSNRHSLAAIFFSHLSTAQVAIWEIASSFNSASKRA
jgi:hypothetical protein